MNEQIQDMIEVSKWA